MSKDEFNKTIHLAFRNHFKVSKEKLKINSNKQRSKYTITKASINLFKGKNGNSQTMCENGWNLFQIKNKHISNQRCSGISIVNFGKNFTHYFVSIVDLEHVNAAHGLMFQHEIYGDNSTENWNWVIVILKIMINHASSIRKNANFYFTNCTDTISTISIHTRNSGHNFLDWYIQSVQR